MNTKEKQKEPILDEIKASYTGSSRTPYDVCRQFVNTGEMPKELSEFYDSSMVGNISNLELERKLLEQLQEKEIKKAQTAKRRSVQFLAGKVYAGTYGKPQQASGISNENESLPDKLHRDFIVTSFDNNVNDEFMWGKSGNSFVQAKERELTTEEFEKYDPTKKRLNSEEYDFMNNINNIV